MESVSGTRKTPSSMAAMVLRQFGGPEALELTDTHPVPVPGADEVLVAVRSVSVGRTLDLATRAGRPPFAEQVQLPHVLGAEHAGEIAARGEWVEGLEVGTRVAVFPVISCRRCSPCVQGRTEVCREMRLLGVHRPGAYAAYCRVPAANVQPIPADMSYSDASALALNGPVAQRQLSVAGTGPGDWLMVTGAAGALGTAVCTLALHLGMRVVGCARQPWQRDALDALGVEAAVDPAGSDFTARIRALTDGQGVSAVVDNLALPELAAALPEVLAPGGVLVTSGALGAATVQVDLRALYLRSQRLVGVRTARLADTDVVWKAARQDGLRPVTDRAAQFSLEAAADAHRYLEAGRNFGRVVLSVS